MSDSYRIRVESGVMECRETLERSWRVQMSSSDRTMPVQVMSAAQATAYADALELDHPGLILVTDELRRHAARCLARGVPS